MKRSTLSVVLLVTTSSAVASFDGYGKLTGDDIEYCADMQGVAREVMQQRQSGKTIMEAIKIAKKEDKGEWLKYRMAMVSDAYNHPVFDVDFVQKDTIQKFENEIGTACLNTVLAQYEEDS